VLEETSPGAVLGTVSSLGLDDLDDVTLGALTDGYVLTYNSGTGQWVAEAPPGGVPYTDEMAQDAVGAMLLDTASVDLAYVDATPSLSATVLPAGVNHNALANLATGDPHTQYLLISAADERAQDAVGAMAVDTATIDVTYTDATPELKWDVKDGSITYAKIQDVSAASKLIGRGDSGAGDPQEITLGTNLSISGTTLNATGGGVADGDKGDITVSGSGTTWTVDNDAITYAKIQNVSTTDRLLGRATAGAGDVEEIPLTAFGRSLIDDAAASNARTTLGLVIGTDVQAWDEILDDLAGLTHAADKLPYMDSATTMATADLTAAGRALLDDANAAAQRSTLGVDTLQVSVMLGDGTNVISTGVVPGDLYFKFPVTITEWILSADASGSIVLDLWVDSYANFPPTVADTITASAKPTLSSASKNKSSTLTGWTTAIPADRFMRLNVDSVATIKRAVLTLVLTRT
jgi:hypothetical protein